MLAIDTYTIKEGLIVKKITEKHPDMDKRKLIIANKSSFAGAFIDDGKLGLTGSDKTYIIGDNLELIQKMLKFKISDIISHFTKYRQDFLEKEGIDTRVQTAITMGQVAEPYIPRRAIRHLEKGRVVIFGAGAGMPFFTTDTVAAQRALEVSAEALLLAKSGVDGVYSADPKKDPSAVKYQTVSFDDVLSKSLAVADAAAFSLCRENKLPIVVFDLKNKGNIARAVRGDSVGTLVS
jgi:hypothetical protein